MARHYTEPTSPAMAKFFKGLGKRLKKTRLKRGLTQTELSKRATIGLRHLQDLEAGYVFSLRLLWSVSKALKVSVWKLTKGLGPGKES